MPNKITMDMLLPNESGIVIETFNDNGIHQRLQDLGIIEGTVIKCLTKSPLGDPKAYLIRGAVISIRDEDAKGIVLNKISNNIQRKNKTVMLAGNPNVGKSTLFNSLTGMKQHTGNWTGKTVSSAKGHFSTENIEYTLVDLPGTYSLDPHSGEEEVTKDCIQSKNYDGIVVVCDGTNLEHSLYLVLQILEITNSVIVCVNLLDEAERKNIKINIEELSTALGVTAVGVTARKKKSLIELTNQLDVLTSKSPTEENISTEKCNDSNERIRRAEDIAKRCVKFNGEIRKFSHADKVLTSRLWGYPIMILLLVALFWITINGANYPSALLSDLLFTMGDKIKHFFVIINLNETLSSILIDGVYNMTARVIAVMLPPMAIFFPLFTILEDLGYLPRIAFNLDRPFNKCNACGKQALTMCMGFGCNACGVTGARIIDSPRERLLAIITNSFVPCNGKFPTIIAIISMFLVNTSNSFITSILSSLVLTLVILLGVVLTFCSTKLLSHTLLKGDKSAFTLELPPYRKPQVLKVIIRSVFDRTIFVLGRAIAAAAPAGLLVWCAANITIGGIPILSHITVLLDPLASLFGIDGIILAAFIFGIAANETVIPIMIMAYLSLGTPIELESLTELRELLVANGWTWITAICTIIFTLLHWPCATTLITVKKETGSLKWTFVSAVLPTLFGLLICFVISTLSRLIL